MFLISLLNILQLASVIAKSGKFAEHETTKDDIRKKILAVCEDLRHILSDKLANVQSEVSGLKKTVSTLNRKIDFLIRLLKKSVADQVSETFIDSLEPVNEMLASAGRGNKADLLKTCKLLDNQMKHFANLADMICDMTDNKEGKRMIQISLEQLLDLKSKLKNAIEVFSRIPDSKAAQENVQIFKKSWVDQVKIFMDAVDDVISVVYFLNVVENHVLDDVKRCCRAMENREVNNLVNSSRAIYQRCGRLCDLVTADMERYEPGVFTDRVLEAVRMLRKDIMTVFSRRVSEMIKNARNNQDIDENDFIDACRMVYDGVRDVRHCYVSSLDPDESGIDSEMEEDSITEVIEDKQRQSSQPREKTTIREAVSKLKSEDIQVELSPDSPVYWVAVWSNPQVRNLLSTADLGGSQVDGFQEEKEKFDKEVLKWEDNNNDIIVLAKYMCSIMTDMTEFIKGRGKLKTTNDIIDSAQKIRLAMY